MHLMCLWNNSYKCITGYKVGCNVKPWLLGRNVNFIISPSLLVNFYFFEVNEHLMICWIFGYWLLCSERRESTLYKPLSTLFFKVIVAVYHGLLLIACLCKTFSMEIFGFHVWSAMNLTRCSTSAWFTRRLFLLLLQ